MATTHTPGLAGRRTLETRRDRLVSKRTTPVVKDAGLIFDLALIYHGGGLLIGSSEIIPQPQIEWLASQGFAVVIPNYRLAPQVDGKTAYRDSEHAYEWSVSSLAEIMSAQHEVKLDSTRVVSMGHSTGGTIALHIGATKAIKAVTAFYPSLYFADKTTSSHLPCTAPPFGQMPDFEPSEEDWKLIKPEGQQLSEAPLAAPGTVPPPRNKWQMSILKKGAWLKAICPDGDFSAIDPLSRLGSHWSPVMFVQGDMDNVPGSSLNLVQRAVKDMEAAGVKEVVVKVVPGETHMFDLPPMVGTSDLGPKWQAVVAGLSFLKSHV